MSSERENTDWMKPFNFRDSELFISMAHFLEENMRDNKSVWIDDAYARMVMSLFYYERDFFKSVGYFKKSINLDPSFWRSMLLAASHIVTREDFLPEEAPWEFEGVFNYPPDTAASFFRLPFHSDNEKVNALVNLGIFYRDQAEVTDGNRNNLKESVYYYHQAIQCFEKATQLEPSLWQAQMMLFMCYVRLGTDTVEDFQGKKKRFFEAARDYKIFDNDETRIKIRKLLQKLMIHSPGFRKKLFEISGESSAHHPDFQKKSNRKENTKTLKNDIKEKIQ